ncbi:hypothetical protein VHUM_00544 [Vanrija humicola]|uniref:40S ribosomal protein S25 n=1 Tax=Vanrija humicola TaxID=5417 RepID=A0A7D8Z1J5_VANHU|nr:hypothetical protein VHUM_00544 [Vanrija humicola]
MRAGCAGEEGEERARRRQLPAAAASRIFNNVPALTPRSKKKKWSKGKVKDKANNAVALDKQTYDRILKEVPTYKLISQSVLIDRMKINGSLARRAIAFLEKEGLIKRVVHHHAQLIYTRATAGKE